VVSLHSALHDQRASWHNPRIIFVLCLVFLCGAASGVVAMKVRWSFQAKATGAYWKDGNKTITLNRFKKELNLTPEQAVEIEAALDEFVNYYQSLQMQMDDFRAYGKQRIMKALNAEQKVRFEEMLTDLQAARLR
jgi:hypothetical protein